MNCSSSSGSTELALSRTLLEGLCTNSVGWCVGAGQLYPRSRPSLLKVSSWRWFIHCVGTLYALVESAMVWIPSARCLMLYEVLVSVMMSLVPR